MASFSHLDKDGNPSMVNVSEKKITHRVAVAKSIVKLSAEIMSNLDGDDIQTKKGPVFQTAILAGIMGVKRTSDLIPLCHQLNIQHCSVDIEAKDYGVDILCTVKCSGQTGVEMEALTGASIAALTIYDMCKAFSHDIIIEQTRLIEKMGGKSDYKLKE